MLNQSLEDPFCIRLFATFICSSENGKRLFECAAIPILFALFDGAELSFSMQAMMICTPRFENQRSLHGTD